MSMLTAQVDKLRERAATLRQGRWSDGVDDARLMEDAADTIWELRDDLQRSNAENAKLRELLRDAWGVGHPDRSCDGCDIRDECHDDVERMRRDGVLRFSRCLFELRIEDRMRELGIEVGDGVS